MLPPMGLRFAEPLPAGFVLDGPCCNRLVSIVIWRILSIPSES